MYLFVKYLIYLIFIVGPVVLVVVLYNIRLQRKKISWMKSQKFTIFRILVPKNNEKAPVAAEQMFASLHGIFKSEEKWQQQISFEIVSKDRFIHFFVRVPRHLKDFIEGQIYAQYPTVEISEVEDYTQIETHGLKSIGSELVLSKPYVYPIKTFKNFDVDPLSAITSVLSKVQEKEQAWIQIILRPVSDRWQDKGISYINSVRNGGPLRGNIFGFVFKSMLGFIGEVISSVVSGESASQKNKEIRLSGPQEAALKGIEEKVTKLGYGAKIRILVLATDEHTARAKTQVIGGAFKQFNTTNLNGFELGKITRGREYLKAYQERQFYDGGYILNIEEVASLYHLPNTSVETPNIVWAGSKKGEPPSNLPVEGSTNEEELTIFAKTDFRNITQRFGIKSADRHLHMYAIGKTGTGKSTMLENMIINDIRMGKGLAVVDPHGELINHILDFIPSSRVNDVIYFNPSDRDFPIGFNILGNVEADLKNIVASGVVGIFKKIFTAGGASGVASWGPRLEYILRNVILALLDYPDSTMLGIMRLLTDKVYRKKVIDKVKDPVIRDYFINEFERYDPKFRTEAISPIQNKVGQFLSSSTIRNIVGQPKDTIDIEKAMNDGKILLVDLSVGKIGEDNSALLGAMIITKIQLAAMRRANIEEAKRRDFYLYVDEFQNFATESFAVILSEARKYRLNLIMTNQYIAQMLESVANAIFGNVGTIISFRVGAKDSAALVKEFEPVFEANDMVNLSNYHIYVKMAIDGVTRPAFSAVTLPPYEEKNENREKIIGVSRERYSKPREFVEGKIQEWSDEGLKKDTIEAIVLDKAEKIKKIIAGEKKLKINKIGDSSYLETKDVKGKDWFLATNIDEKLNQEETKELKNGETEELKNKEIDNQENKETPNSPNYLNLTKEQAEKQEEERPEEKKEKIKLKPLLKPIIEKKTQKAIAHSSSSDHLITLEETYRISKKDKDIKPLKAGESVKI